MSPLDRARALFRIEATGMIHRPWILHTPDGDEVFHSVEAAESYRDNLAIPIVEAVAEAERAVRRALVDRMSSQADALFARADKLRADGLDDEAYGAHRAGEELASFAEAILGTEDVA